jgi:hypothetical protein
MLPKCYCSRCHSPGGARGILSDNSALPTSTRPPSKNMIPVNTGTRIHKIVRSGATATQPATGNTSAMAARSRGSYEAMLLSEQQLLLLRVASRLPLHTRLRAASRLVGAVRQATTDTGHACSSNGGHGSWHACVGVMCRVSGPAHSPPPALSQIPGVRMCLTRAARAPQWEHRLHPLAGRQPCALACAQRTHGRCRPHCAYESTHTPSCIVATDHSHW